MKNDDYLIQRYLRSRIKHSQHYPYCWEWLGSFNGAGYGQFRWNGEYKLAHREAYYQKYRYIPKKWVVHHRCKNKKCINPGHTVAIRQSRNIKLALKGRRLHQGESNGNSKLTEAEVELIREFSEVGFTQRTITKLMGVSEATVNRIITGKSWKHLLQKPAENREQNPIETV